MMYYFSNTGDTPVGSVIAYAGRLSTPVVSQDTGQAYPEAEQQTGLTNNIEGFGWMVCDGRMLYCKDYPQLYQAIGNLYDNDSGNTDSANATFRIPDYRGYFLRGASGNSNNDPDQGSRKFTDGRSASDPNDDVGSFQEDALQTHEHSYSETTAIPSNAGDVPEGSSKTMEQEVLTGKPTNSLSPSSNTVKTSTNETRPRNFYVYYLIKYCHVEKHRSQA